MVAFALEAFEIQQYIPAKQVQIYMSLFLNPMA